LQAGVRSQPEEAARLAKRILESYPNSPEALAARGMVP
jgi:regulator of sirC expression with transglutaminase-like and TPR domain